MTVIKPTVKPALDEAFSGVISESSGGGSPPPWILETSFWNDSGIWQDSESWND